MTLFFTIIIVYASLYIFIIVTVVLITFSYYSVFRVIGTNFVVTVFVFIIYNIFILVYSFSTTFCTLFFILTHFYHVKVE